jgi:outer membrane autotransporter protein
VAARYVNDPFNLSNFLIPTNDPDRNFFTLGLGVSAVLTKGMSAFITYERVLGLSHVTANAVVGGVRMEF